jgi:predicted transcriptional regulator
LDYQLVTGDIPMKEVQVEEVTGSLIPEWLERSRDISPGAKLCYARLLRCVGDDEFLTHPQLAEALAISVATSERYVKELRDKGFVSTKQRGSGLSNSYVLYEPQECGGQSALATSLLALLEEDSRSEYPKYPNTLFFVRSDNRVPTNLQMYLRDELSRLARTYGIEVPQDQGGWNVLQDVITSENHLVAVLTLLGEQ